MLGLTKAKRPKLYEVRYSNGFGHTVWRNVVAFNKREARALAGPTVPPALYGPDMVVMTVRRKNFLLTVDSECLQLLTEKIESL
jgi:hypothetical protein